jgi:hypothetical protein
VNDRWAPVGSGLWRRQRRWSSSRSYCGWGISVVPSPPIYDQSGVRLHFDEACAFIDAVRDQSKRIVGPGVAHGVAQFKRTTGQEVALIANLPLQI